MTNSTAITKLRR